MNEKKIVNNQAKKFGCHASEAMRKELKQLHMHNSFIPHMKESMTKEDWKKVCKAVNLMKEKKSGEMKGQTCADGGKQCDHIGEEDLTSLASSTEAVSLTVTMEAKEERKVRTHDTPNVFTQTHWRMKKRGLSWHCAAQ